MIKDIDLKDNLNQFKSYLQRRKAQSTIHSYLSVLRNFLDYSKGNLSRTSLLSFIDSLSSPGYSRVAYYVLRKWFLYNRWEFPLDEEDLPSLSKSVLRPVLTLDEAEKIITWVKQYGTPEAKYYNALSSIYGFRREELAKAVIEGNYVTVEAKKGGEIRNHIIPREIKPYLVKIKPLAIPTLTVLFHKTLTSAGVEGKPQGGWHCWRRLIDGQLISSGVPLLYVKRYLGWSLSSIERLTGMPGFYAQESISQEDIDREVFSRHPIIPMWRL